MRLEEALRAQLKAHGIFLKRSLGQSFLVDADVLDAIADVAVEGGPRAVVEIGAGPGTLSARLAERAEVLVALERDRRLAPILEAALAPYPGARIHWGDALQTSFTALADRPAVAGNLPYSITSPLLLHLLSQRTGLGAVTVMVQREVAERLTASPGTKAYGSLSVLFQLHAELEALFEVPPDAFFPAPEVHSTVLRLEWRGAPRVEVGDLGRFERIVRAAFGQRRKTLLNALGHHYGRVVVAEAGERAAIDLGRRAETLTVEELASLARALPPNAPPASDPD